MRTPWVSLIWSHQRTRTYLFMGFGLFLRSNWAHSWLHVGQQHFFFLSKYSFIVDIWFNGYDFVFFLLLLCLCVIIFYLFILTSHISLFIWYSWVCIISVRDDWKGTSIIIKIYAISSQQMQMGMTLADNEYVYWVGSKVLCQYAWVLKMARKMLLEWEHMAWNYFSKYEQVVEISAFPLNA